MSIEEEVNVFKKNLIQVIKLLCKKKNLSYEELARKSKIDTDELKEILSGKSKSLQISTLLCIAQGLDVPIYEILNMAQQRARKRR